MGIHVNDLALASSSTQWKQAGFLPLKLKTLLGGCGEEWSNPFITQQRRTPGLQSGEGVLRCTPEQSRTHQYSDRPPRAQTKKSVTGKKKEHGRQEGDPHRNPALHILDTPAPWRFTCMTNKSCQLGAWKNRFSINEAYFSGKAWLISQKEMLSHGAAVPTRGPSHFSGFLSGGSVSHPWFGLGQIQLVSQAVCW